MTNCLISTSTLTNLRTYEIQYKITHKMFSFSLRRLREMFRVDYRASSGMRAHRVCTAYRVKWLLLLSPSSSLSRSSSSSSVCDQQLDSVHSCWYQISWKPVVLFWRCYVRTDGHVFSTSFYSTFRCDRAWQVRRTQRRPTAITSDHDSLISLCIFLTVIL